MTPENIERVFGRSRLRIPTGQHVEVVREEAQAGEPRRYSKHFVWDLGIWTRREARWLAFFFGSGVRCVPVLAQLHSGMVGDRPFVQTLDAGTTVDHWVNLLSLQRFGTLYRHPFEDCAHWYSLAHYSLSALQHIHKLGLVHLDIKADNVCIPFWPWDFEPRSSSTSLQLAFGELSLIDFAFAVKTGEELASVPPIGRVEAYAYQSPRLLAALEAGKDGVYDAISKLDWRCDIFSLAAMLERYLPKSGVADETLGWTPARYDNALQLLGKLRATHDEELSLSAAYEELTSLTFDNLRAPDVVESLQRGWTLNYSAAESAELATAATPITPIALPPGAPRPPTASSGPLVVDAQKLAEILAAVPSDMPVTVEPQEGRITIHPRVDEDTPQMGDGAQQDTNDGHTADADCAAIAGPDKLMLIRKAEEGNADAQHALGRIYLELEHEREARHWFEKAAKQRHAAAAAEVAKRCLTEAAAGYPSAQIRIGHMYEHGIGVEQSNREAAKWYQRAADQEDTRAQHELSRMYYERKIAPDDTRPAMWHRYAAEQGIAQAQFALGCAYENGWGIAGSDEEALKWYRKAIAQRHAGAQFRLGCMYEYGRGLPKDVAEATKWYRMAAEQGHREAHAKLHAPQSIWARFWSGTPNPER